MRLAGLSELAARIVQHLNEIGFEMEEDGRLRISGEWEGRAGDILTAVRKRMVAAYLPWLRSNWDRISRWLADGEEVDPDRIRPALLRVEKEIHADLFRLARLLSGFPPTRGVGRRLRYLIVDAGNRGEDGVPHLMGAIGLQSPPISFPPRDRMFRYPKGEKWIRVNQTMHLYAFSAVPPYHLLEGGRLAALLSAASEIRIDYRRKYEGRPSFLSERIIPAHLVALTAVVTGGQDDPFIGLQYRSRPLAIPIGQTTGYSALHLEPFYSELRLVLRALGWQKDRGFGSGPRWKWRVITLSLRRIGLSSEVMLHGVPGRAYLIPLVENLREFMEGEEDAPRYRDLSASDLISEWRRRWLRPVLETSVEYTKWKRARCFDIL